MSPAAPFEGHQPGSPELRRIEVALFLAGLATFGLLYATQPLLPALASDLGVSAGQSAWSVSAATLALGAALLVAGPASEVLGRTGLMHASLALSSALGLAAAAAPGWDSLLVLRALQGLALAGLPAVAVAYLREEVHDSAYGRATGLYIAGTAAGGMLGRLLAAGLGELGGWRVALAGAGALGVVCAVAVRWLLPRSVRFVASSPAPRALLAETRGVLGDPALLAVYGIGFTAMGAFVAVYNALAFRLTSPPYDLSLGTTGLVFCLFVLGSLASALTGAGIDRLGRRTMAPLCCAVMLAGLLLTLARPLWLVVAGLGVMTAGFFATHGVASGWAGARAHAGGRATAQAASLYLVAYYLGSTLVGGAAGAVWSAYGWSGVVILTGSLVGVSLLLTVALRRTRSLLDPGPDDPGSAPGA